VSVRYRVSFTGGRRAAGAPLPPVEVGAASWLSALASALDAAGLVDGVERLACELLPNGSVLARDGRTGQGFVVEPLREGGSLGHRADDDGEPPLAAPDSGEEHTGPTLAEPVSAAVVEAATPEAALALIRRAPTIAAACQAALAVAQRFIPAEAGSVLLRQDQGLYVQAASGPRGGALVGTLLPADRGVVGDVLTRGVGLVVRAADRDPRFEGHIDVITGFHTRDLVCAPLRVGPAPGAEPVGVIQLLNAPQGQTFGGMELKGLLQVADVLGERIRTGHR
jgi:hypothetical protein